MFCGRSLPYKYYINAHNRDNLVLFVGFSQFPTEKLHHSGLCLMDCVESVVSQCSGEGPQVRSLLFSWCSGWRWKFQGEVCQVVRLCFRAGGGTSWDIPAPLWLSGCRCSVDETRPLDAGLVPPQPSWSLRQYLLWCSKCHRLKSMLKATMLPDTMPVIRVLQRKPDICFNHNFKQVRFSWAASAGGATEAQSVQSRVNSLAGKVLVKMCTAAKNEGDAAGSIRKITALHSGWRGSLSRRVSLQNHGWCEGRAADPSGSSCTVWPSGV